MSKVRLATAWLEACSGCHMSLLDMDERLIDLADRIDLVYSPLVDAKEYPRDVDVALVTGGVGNEEQAELAREIRERTKILVSLGDCAVTGNVPALRNRFRLEDVYNRSFRENVDLQEQVPGEGVPPLTRHVLPLHHVVQVDEFVPGCAPVADLIHFILTELLEGRIPGLGVRAQFG